MNDDRCEALSLVGSHVRGIDSYRCRKSATRNVVEDGRQRRVCHLHLFAHVFHDADAIGDAQRDRASRVLAD